MAGSLVLDTRRYAIYVKVIAGEGDGTLIWVDRHGIHHGPGDPSPLSERVHAAIKQIEAGIDALSIAAKAKVPA